MRKQIFNTLIFMSNIASPDKSGNLSRRQSQSAPALLALDRLITSTLSLSQRVSALGETVRASRSSVLLPNSPALEMSSTEAVKQRTCHACHAPVSLHTEIPTGLNRCPLPHWDGCQGGHTDGKAPNGSEWRGCPPDFIPGSSLGSDDSQKDEFEDTLSHVSHADARGEDDVFSELKETKKSETEEIKIQEENSNEFNEVDDDTLDATPDNEQKKLLDLQARNKLLKEQFARHQAQKDEQEKLERERLIKLVEAENLRLVNQMNGDTGGARQRPAQSAGPGSSLPGSQSAPRSRQTVPAQAAPSSWHHSYQKHLTKNQVKASQPATLDPPLYKGLDMNGIRKIPNLQTGVESLVEQVQGFVPSLDRRPTAGLGNFSNSMPATKPAFSHQVGASLGGSAALPGEDEFVYVRRDDGTLFKVPVMNENQIPDTSSQQLGLKQHHTGRVSAKSFEDEDPLASSDDDCPFVPKPGWRHIWRRSSGGEKYFTEERIPAPLPGNKYEWVKDKKTGRTTKRLVPCRVDQDLELRTVIDPKTGSEVQMLVPRTPTRPSSGHPSTKQSVSRTPTRIDRRVQPDRLKGAPLYERAPSYIAPTDDKQGKENKVPVLVQYARNCPVAWTSKVTSDKMNMGLWCYAYMGELLATRTGAASALAPGELEARMQHFLNVLEISLQPSSPVEFDGHSWRVARLYAEKVQQKVDKGSSWVSFEQRYGADTHPHELMAAQVELPPPPKKTIVEKKPDKKVEKGKDGKDKRLCTTWNSSEVENKCKFEVNYEGRECNNKHECSWCKEKHGRSLPHQRNFCRQRITAGEQ